MRKHIILTFVLLAICGAVFTSCSSDKKEGKTVTAKAQSAPYELLIVADKSWLKTQAGEEFVNTVAGPIEGLPQAEPAFRVTSVNPAQFTSTFRTYSNIVRVDISKKHKKATASMTSDVYCKPQVIITFEAPDDAALMEYLATESAQQAVNVLVGQELGRERGILSKHYSNVVMNETKKMFGYGINAPQDIDEVKKGKNFLWGSASKQEFRLNVCVYSLPLKDMTAEDFIAARDSVMKINIPGDREDQWMETDSRTVAVKIIKPQGKEVMEVRGLWDMRNDAMGGPFVSYVQTDLDNDRLIVTEGFVFAPEEKKRPLIRELEAMLQTLIIL